MAMAGTGGAPDPLLLRHAAAQVDQYAAGVVERRELTLNQWRMLEVLVTRGPATMAELAAALSLTGPTTTRIADHLVTTALAYRDVDTADRRRVVVRAARRGRRLHDDLAPSVHAAQADALGRLDDTEQRTLASLLRRVTVAPDPADLTQP